MIIAGTDEATRLLRPPLPPPFLAAPLVETIEALLEMALSTRSGSMDGCMASSEKNRERSVGRCPHKSLEIVQQMFPTIAIPSPESRLQEAIASATVIVFWMTLSD